MGKKHSRDSIRRFVQVMLGLETPTFMFHQTLTFSPPELDAKAAKAKLKRLLDNRFIRGAVYSEERQGNGGFHYQLLLFYYDKHGLPFPASKMEEGVRAAVFEAWNRYNGGRLARMANKLKLCKFNAVSIEYLVKEAVNRDACEARITNWWGKKAKFLVKRPTPPTKQEVAQKMKQLLPSRPILPRGLRCSMRALMREKRDYLEVCIRNPSEEWEEAKQRETGRTDVVSDAELLAFRKARAAEWRKRQRAVP
jgi:hypothetical protein